MTLAPALEQLDRLRAILREMRSVLVCYSGGVDSALVLAVATQELGRRAVAMTAVSPSLAPLEQENAARVAITLGAEHRFVESHELLRPGYAANGPDRCFHCKSELYEIAEQKRVEWDLAYIVNGTNLDDLGDYRPGLDAARRAHVRSPLVEAELGKADVRALAKLLELDVWDKPAGACLSSRLPYGTRVTPERLTQIGGFEAELRALGFPQVRVRWHGELARIEVERSELPRLVAHAEEVANAGRRHGFAYVTLDLLGYRVGSHNEALLRTPGKGSGRTLPVVD